MEKRAKGECSIRSPPFSIESTRTILFFGRRRRRTLHAFFLSLDLQKKAREEKKGSAFFPARQKCGARPGTRLPASFDTPCRPRTSWIPRSRPLRQWRRRRKVREEENSTCQAMKIDYLFQTLFPRVLAWDAAFCSNSCPDTCVHTRSTYQTKKQRIRAWLLTENELLFRHHLHSLTSGPPPNPAAAAPPPRPAPPCLSQRATEAAAGPCDHCGR